MSETLSRNPRHEPQESPDVTRSSRNETYIREVGSGIDLPDPFLDEDGFAKNWKQCRDAYVALRREEDSYGGTTTSKRVAAQKHYRQCLDLSRITRHEYDHRHIALVSLRISPTLGDGHYLAPTAMVGELVEAYSASWRKLKYQLDKRDIEFEYFKVIAPTETFASPHIHLVIFANDTLKKEYFKNFCDAFVDNCPFAEDGTNQPDDGAVEILAEGDFLYEHHPKDGEKGPVDPFTRYAATQIPHQGSVDESTEAELFHGATMYASGKSACTKSRCVEKDEISIKSIRVDLPEKSSIDSTDSLSTEFVERRKPLAPTALIGMESNHHLYRRDTYSRQPTDFIARYSALPPPPQRGTGVG